VTPRKEAGGVTDVLLEKLGANRRVVVRPNLGDTSAPAVLIDRDHVVDVRELAGAAVVLASSGLSHFPQKTTGGVRTVHYQAAA
jgi:hypothetical protein